jgi:hypothetical protein
LSRTAGTKIEKTFIKGLITESTGLNYPVDSCTSTLNCIFDQKGRVTRRLGLDYESGYVLNSFNRNSAVVYEFYWKNAGSTGLDNLIVSQIGNNLYFYRDSSTVSLSSTYGGLTVNLNTYAIGATTNIPKSVCQFTVSEGRLFVVHPLCDPFYIVYSSVGPSITATRITIKTRDLKGDTSDAYIADPTTRPTATTGTVGNAHMYNLYNQGWALPVKNISGTTVNPVTFWDSVLTTIPSNSDIWYLFKDATNKFDPVNFADTISIGNTPAPKGYYVMSPFATTRSALSGFSGILEDTSNGLRPSCVGSFAGRIWYAGVNADGYSQKIYFSQIIVKQTEYGDCFQLNDPTSDNLNQTLPTDGGVISIPEVGTVIKLFTIQNSLLVFGTGGVWAITGSSGVGFTADDYAVVKMSSTGALSPLSFVDLYGAPIWWTTEGIYTISTDNSGSQNAAKSLTDNSIKTVIDSIHPDSKKYVKGVFNPYDKTITWLYSSSVAATLQNSYEYDSALVLNTLSAAFYQWSLPTGDPTVNGLIVSKGPTVGVTGLNVVDSTLLNLVVTTAGEQIVTPRNASVNPNYSVRFLTSKNVTSSSWNFTWSQMTKTDYKDWGAVEPQQDYSSYFFTSYQLDGDAIKFFQNNYIVTFMDSVPNGSAFFEAWLEYTTTTTNARVTNPQQIYPSDSSSLAFSVLQRRMKVRGRGRSIQFHFYSETGKPFSLVGWSIWSTANSSI